MSQCLSMGDVPKFAKLMSDAQMECWDPCLVVAIDETIMEWLGNGEWIHYIPGKPTQRVSGEDNQKPYIGCLSPLGGEKMVAISQKHLLLLASFPEGLLTMSLSHMLSLIPVPQGKILWIESKHLLEMVF